MLGILQVLCKQENYFEAYGWALHLHDIYPDKQIAIDVILDVRERLGCLKYLEELSVHLI